MNNQTPIEVSSEVMLTDATRNADECCIALVSRVAKKFPGMPLRIHVDLQNADSEHADMSPAAPVPSVSVRAIFKPLAEPFALEAARFEGYLSRFGISMFLSQDGAESLFANPIGMAWFVGWYNRARLQEETDAARKPVIHEGMADAPKERPFFGWHVRREEWVKLSWYRSLDPNFTGSWIESRCDPLLDLWEFTHWQECLPPPAAKVLWEQAAGAIPPGAGSTERFVANPGEYGTRPE